jgi:hypothetical protein
VSGRNVFAPRDAKKLWVPSLTPPLPDTKGAQLSNGRPLSLPRRARGAGSGERRKERQRCDSRMKQIEARDSSGSFGNGVRPLFFGERKARLLNDLDALVLVAQTHQELFCLITTNPWQAKTNADPVFSGLQLRTVTAPGTWLGLGCELYEQRQQWFLGRAGTSSRESVHQPIPEFGGLGWGFGGSGFGGSGLRSENSTRISA